MTAAARGRDEPYFEWAARLFDPSGRHAKPEALRGLRVLDLLADPGPGTVVFGPVNLPTQTLAESHWWERGCFARLDDPVYGPLILAAPARRMSRTPPRLKAPGRPAGYHTAHVLARHLGMGPTRLAELRARRII